MADETIVFTVNILPPPRPRGSVRDASHDDDEDDGRRSMRVNLKPSDTMEQVWHHIQQKWEKNYPLKEREGADFNKLQDPLGSDMARDSTVRDLFHNFEFKDRVINVNRVAIDKESSLAPGSHLQPRGYRRTRLEDLTPERQEAYKRRKLEEGRYGTALGDLGADTPVTSREGAQRDVLSEVPHELDEDGFKIPRRIAPVRRRRRSNQTPRSSQEVVLVEDSQPTVSPNVPPSAAAPLRQRQSNSLEQQRAQVIRSAGSSPSAGTLARPNVTPKPGTIPTPDSNHLPNSSSEPPTSGQRPRSSGAPISVTSGRFISRRSAAQPQPEFDTEDPIEDDLNDNTFDVDDDDYNDNGGRITASRHRARSRSPEVIIRSQASSGEMPPSSQSLPDSAPRNALDDSNGSQANPGPWTTAEDRALLRGFRMGYRGHSLQRNFVPNRSESAIRNRRVYLLKNHPDMINPDEAGEDEHTAPRSSQRTLWAYHEIETVRKAFVEGLDINEIVAKHFPARSADSVRNKLRTIKVSTLNMERKKADFPRSNIQAEKWTDDHNLRLRRHFLQKENNDEKAWKLWFSAVDKMTFQRKLAEYKTQMSNPENALNTGREASTTVEPLSQSESLNTRLGDQPSTQESGEFTSTATQPRRQDHSQSTTQTHISSSPPFVFSSDSREQEQQTANQEDDDVYIVNEHVVTPRAQISAPPARPNGNGGQTTLGQYFQRDKGKAPDRPARPSTSELDAQFGRGPSGAAANLNQQQVDSQPEPSDQQHTSSADSERESVSDVEPSDHQQQNSAGDSEPESVSDHEPSDDQEGSSTGSDPESVSNDDEVESSIGKDWDKLSKEAESEQDYEAFSRDAESQLLVESQGLYSQQNAGHDSEAQMDPESTPASEIPVELADPDDQIHVPRTPLRHSVQRGSTSLQEYRSPSLASEATPQVVVETQITEFGGPNIVQSSNNINIAGPLLHPPAESPRRSQSRRRLTSSIAASSRLQERISTQNEGTRSPMDSTTQSPSQPANGISVDSTTQSQSQSQPVRRRNAQRTTQSPAQPVGGRSIESTTQSQSQPLAGRIRLSTAQSQSPAQTRRDSTTQSQSHHLSQSPESRSHALIRPPQGQVLASNRTQAHATPRAPRDPREMNGQRWIPFEKRPLTDKGQLDAGRPGFPLYMDYDHSWVRSDDAIWTEACEKAKPEWVQEMYCYLRDTSLQLIRWAAEDWDDAAIIRERMHAARVDRRKKMGLPPLHTLRGPRYIVPGMEDVSEAENEVDSQYEPDPDDDDGLDITGMNAVESQPEASSDDSSVGAILDREIVELEDGEEEDEILNLNHDFMDSDDEEPAFLLGRARVNPSRRNPAPAGSELQEPVQDAHVDVYDDASSFLETKSFHIRSCSPTVETTMLPGHSGDDHPSIFNLDGADERTLGRARNTRPNNHISSRATSGETLSPREPIAQRNIQVGYVLDVPTPSLPLAETAEINQTQPMSKKRKRSRPSGTTFVNGGSSNQPELTQQSKEDEHIDSQNLKGNNENDRRKRRKKTKRDISNESKNNSTPAFEAKDPSSKKAEDDRAMMQPPPPVRRDRQALSRESIGTDITSTPRSTPNGLQNDGTRKTRHRRKRPKKNATLRSTMESLADDAKNGDVAGAATPSRGALKRLLETETALPASNKNVNEWLSGQDLIATTEQPRRTAWNYPPPPPRQREVLPPVPPKMPYGSDDDDSSSSESGLE